MDALWNLEDKLDISTQGAIGLLVCTTLLVILSLVATIVMFLKIKAQRRNRITSHDCSDIEEAKTDNELLVIHERNSKKARSLRSSACWSRAKKWEDIDVAISKYKYWLGVGGKLPVWQRPILRGEKCELPRFSGLILYDERGRPLPNNQHQQCHDDLSSNAPSNYEVEAEIARTTMLKDLL